MSRQIICTNCGHIQPYEYSQGNIILCCEQFIPHTLTIVESLLAARIQQLEQQIDDIAEQGDFLLG